MKHFTFFKLFPFYLTGKAVKCERKKAIFVKLLLIILLLISARVYSQTDTLKPYCFSAEQIRLIANDKLELKYLQGEIKLWFAKDSLSQIVISDLKQIVKSEKDINISKEKQIILLEARPQVIENKANWTFWHLIGAVILTGISIYAGTQIK